MLLLTNLSVGLIGRARVPRADSVIGPAYRAVFAEVRRAVTEYISNVIIGDSSRALGPAREPLKSGT